MSQNQTNKPELSNPKMGIKDHRRRIYQKPHLTPLGDLRSLTLGGSPGSKDTGPSNKVQRR
jgi:hypothetical protein